ncbi:MAG: hypothetical protein AAGG51_15025 [Cyanobacteria bacterium P01_G01_bin.54]
MLNPLHVFGLPTQTPRNQRLEEQKTPGTTVQTFSAQGTGQNTEEEGLPSLKMFTVLFK